MEPQRQVLSVDMRRAAEIGQIIKDVLWNPCGEMLFLYPLAFCTPSTEQLWCVFTWTRKSEGSSVKGMANLLRRAEVTKVDIGTPK